MVNPEERRFVYPERTGKATKALDLERFLNAIWFSPADSSTHKKRGRRFSSAPRFVFSM
jgi:hypothetical protein